MTRPDWIDRGSGHIWLPYTQMQTAPEQVAIVGAEGAELITADGRRLIDGIASWWTAAHGYRHPHITAALHAQVDMLQHVMLGGLAHEQPYRLAERLAGLLPGDLNHVFFSESGSISVEVAMKMAVQYWLNQGQQRTRFLSFTGGYHGDSFATMSVCDPDEGMHQLFRGVVAEQAVVDLPDTAERLAALEMLLEREGSGLAAIIIEPLVQGAGGMRFHDDTVLATLRRLCDQYRLLLIFDEIFIGFGRTGRALFACEATGVTPDIVTLSKALTGGTLPLAATIATTQVYEAFLSDKPGHALMHGPTYMGNAMACAAANASLDLFLSEPRIAQAQAIGASLTALLKPARVIPGVRDVRVQGAIGVIQLDQPIGEQMTRPFIECGVWLRPFGDIIYTTPPLIASPDQIEQIASAMIAGTRAWSERKVG